MARRFLTSEDVHNARETVIVVDDSTVVTPQALEAAQAAGIAIRTASGGAWSEPVPDRGPDADAARRVLPHMPEPEDNPSLASTAIVIAIGKNRGGVLAELTAAIAQEGGNVHDVSQKVFDGFFHVILTVELGNAPFDALKTRLECMGSPSDFAVNVMHERVFRFMHRV